MKFQLIIRDIESGEVICDKKCDCILGAFAGNVTESAISAGVMSYSHGTVSAAINAIDAAEEAVDRMKKVICEDFKKKCEAEIPYEELSDFVKKVSSRISVDEDAIKEMAEKGADAE